jgi:hypothetical protein
VIQEIITVNESIDVISQCFIDRLYKCKDEEFGSTVFILKVHYISKFLLYNCEYICDV